MSENDIEKIRASKIEPIVEAYKEAQKAEIRASKIEPIVEAYKEAQKAREEAQKEANSPKTFVEMVGQKKQEQNNQISVLGPR